MSISDKLAGLNAARFAEWTKIHNENNSRPALFAFKGDVYTGLDAFPFRKMMSFCAIPFTYAFWSLWAFKTT